MLPAVGEKVDNHAGRDRRNQKAAAATAVDVFQPPSLPGIWAISPGTEDTEDTEDNQDNDPSSVTLDEIEDSFPIPEASASSSVLAGLSPTPQSPVPVVPLVAPIFQPISTRTRGRSSSRPA